MKNRTKLLTIASALALALLAGCGSGDDSYSKPKEAAASDCTPSADNNGCRGEIYADGYPEGHSGMNESAPGDGFGEYAAYDTAGGGETVIVSITEDGYTDKTVKAASEYLKQYVDGGDPSDFTWIKVIVDNTDGTEPYMPSMVELRAVINDGEQVDGSLTVDTYTIGDLYGDDAVHDPWVSGDATVDEEDAHDELEARVNLNEDTEVLPGTTATFAGVLEGKARSVESVWVGWTQAGSTD